MSEAYVPVVWTEKYRPTKIEDVIFGSEQTKKFIQTILDNNEMTTNIMFYGNAGMGKNCLSNLIAKSIMADPENDVLIINGSLTNDVQTMREVIYTFATSYGVATNTEGKANHRIIMLHESDYLSNSAQAVLRELMEECDATGVCKFIFTCNYPDKLMDAIHSRCAKVEMTAPNTNQIVDRCLNILENEKIIPDIDMLEKIISMHYPDIRGIINSLQKCTISGGLENIEIKFDIDTIIGHINNSDVREIQNFTYSLNVSDIRYCYELLAEHITKLKEPAKAMILLGKYAYQHALVIHHVLNFTCCLIELQMMQSDENE